MEALAGYGSNRRGAQLMLSVKRLVSTTKLACSTGGRSQHVATAHVDAGAINATEHPTRFADEERASRQVPRLQAELEVAVEAATRDVRQVERRAAHATNALRLRTMRSNSPSGAAGFFCTS